MEPVLRVAKKILPRPLFDFFQPAYHYALAALAALAYRFPSRRIKVVAITGTKGKTSTAEFLNSILETAGYQTALASTLRFKLGDDTRRNTHRMTMPGRFFVQKFIRQAVAARCDYAIVEMTSEGARQFRHKFIALDALIFLNISLEHIESHGSYENYVNAKLLLADALQKSPKRERVLVVNADDAENKRFIQRDVPNKVPFALAHAEPYTLGEDGVQLTFRGTTIRSPLRGEFTVYNILAAATYALSQNVPLEQIKRGIERVREIGGRLQKIPVPENKFEVVIDYAHTPDSLEKLYKAFPEKRKVCVLGNTGGGRDKWKRAEMGRIADLYCEKVFLTNEDPYDENPRAIVDQMAEGMKRQKPEIIMDRRETRSS